MIRLAWSYFIPWDSVRVGFFVFFVRGEGEVRVGFGLFFLFFFKMGPVYRLILRHIIRLSEVKYVMIDNLFC